MKAATVWMRAPARSQSSSGKLRGKTLKAAAGTGGQAARGSRSSGEDVLRKEGWA